MANNEFFCYGDSSQEKIELDGVAYLSGNCWDGSDEGQKTVISDINVRAKYLYILGGCNSLDIAHPAWGGGWAEKNFFIGNELGQILVTYADSTQDIVPLIYGYTAFTNQGYKNAPGPFSSDAKYRKMLDDALCVANAVNGFETQKSDYYFRIALRNSEVSKIELRDSEAKKGIVAVRGLSFAGVVTKPIGSKFQTIKATAMPKEKADWLAKHTISSQDSYPKFRRGAVKKLQDKFYTSPAQITSEVVARTSPRVLAKDFKGPKVAFSGSPVAEILTNIYYDNTTDLMQRIDEDGMVHESAKGSDYYNSFGGWAPNLGAFHGDAYTRLRGLTLLTNIGMEEKVNASIKFFDKWLMYFPESFPEIQLGGKPVPGHATVVANKPHVYFDKLKNVGWPTKYTTRDFGNPEVDGHGLLMITRWRAWSKQGRNSQWVTDRWAAINEAAEFIPWALDNPELSFSEHGLLYNETEGGRYAPSMYCDFVCYLGLLGYAEMAETVGNEEKASRWRKQATRLYDAMMAYYPIEKQPWGKVWDPNKNAMFHYTHSTLAPVCIGMDYWGYDVKNLLPEGWLEITQNTYKMQLERNEPQFAATAGIGYGQGYITQSAMLLDEMSDAEKMIDWMAKICFAPNLKFPYTVPEGSIIDHGGKMWRRWGDLGNLYQLNEVVYTTQLIIGIDDVDSAQLKIMPRMPRDWSGIKVKDWPVRVTSGGASKLVNMAMEYSRSSAAKLSYKVIFDNTVDNAMVRVGPFDNSYSKLKISGKKQQLPLFQSGDSKWAWIELESKSNTHLLNIMAVK